MKTSHQIWGLLLLLPAIHSTECHAVSLLSGPIVNPGNGHTYYLLDTATWEASEAAAVALGGHLVTISSAAENEWVYNTFQPLQPSVTPHATLWIGLSDAKQEGQWCWANGELVPYVNWWHGQPDNADNGNVPGVGQDYAHLWTDGNVNPTTTEGQWDDYNNVGFSATPYGVVEIGSAEATTGPTCWTPEPQSYALVASMALSGLALARRCNRRPQSSK